MSITKKVVLSIKSQLRIIWYLILSDFQGVIKVFGDHMTYSLCPIGQKFLTDHALLTSAKIYPKI